MVVRKLATMLLTLGLFVVSLTAAAEVGSVGAFGVTVEDLDRSVAFYTGVLDFEVVSETEVAGTEIEHLTGVFGTRARIAVLQLGEEFVELTDYLAPVGRPVPIDSRSNDLWFQHIAIIVADMDAAYARLRGHDVEYASSGPQRLPDWNPDAGGIEAFYFKDPDGHVLEVLAFPPDKGDPRWRRPSDELFLGIDHTAIVVSDTETSLAFYRDQLGMEVIGGSENHGIEQERLNNVFGAWLRITTLRAPGGPAVEFLEYLAPGDGRPYPADSRGNDLWHWHTRIVVTGIEGLVEDLLSAGVPFVSPGAVDAAGIDLGFTRGALIRDPDGHAVQLVEEARR